MDKNIFGLNLIHFNLLYNLKIIIRGTNISKDAADAVLLDDSFSSIFTTCKYGRNVYDFIRKLVQFQLTLTTNIVAIFSEYMAFLGDI